MNVGKLALRLATREYLPFAGWLAGWAIAAAVIGHADTARLFSAFVLARSARALTLMDCTPAMRSRWSAVPAVRNSSLVRAGTIEALSLAAELAVILAMVLLLPLIGQEEAAHMLLLLCTGLPARHLLFLGRRHNSVGLFRAALPWGGVLLLGVAWAANLGATGVVLAIALREWIALLVALPGRPPAGAQAAAEPLEWREVASITGTRARHRLTYRVGKGLIGGLLGPLSGFIARTGRGVGLHRRVGRFVPRKAWPVALLGIGTAAAAVILQVALAKPATLIASASLLRISGVAGSVLLWLRYARDRDDDADDDDDD